MATSNTEAVTLGGLDSAPGGNAARLIVISGEYLVREHTDIVYTVNADGVITAAGTGAAAADMSLTAGAGFVMKQSAIDVDAATGSVATLDFFLNTDGVAGRSSFKIVGCTANLSLDLTGGTVGSAAVDSVLPVGIKTMTGNDQVSLIVGNPVVDPDASPVDLSDDNSIIKFSLLITAVPIHV